MHPTLQSIILKSTGASTATEQEVIQELWSGYGEILRVALVGATVPTVIVKHVQLPTESNHPRGWNTDISHQRKVRSYQVETNWYKTYSKQSHARLPKCFAVGTIDDEVIMILEDLDAAGFPLRKSSASWDEIPKCLGWLAKFHASYLDQEPNGLWENGTYWHLDTRPHELEVLSDQKLKSAALLIDQKLNECRFKTFVHGDSKLANFCFAENGDVAAVDFQYVGGGCGMKDVAYFIGSCLNEDECERLESQILNTYFAFLQNELPKRNAELEAEWRALYRIAWADFHRFLKGWSPGHWKINSYSERITRDVVDGL